MENSPFGAEFPDPEILREHVDGEHFGVKTGRRVLEMTEAQANERIGRRDRAYAGLARLPREVEE